MLMDLTNKAMRPDMETLDAPRAERLTSLELQGRCRADRVPEQGDV